MGRIKSKLVKRTSRAIVAKESNLTATFEKNKKALAGVTPSKRIRNQIAGYISRIKKRTN
jgi:ribosomal protein S17E